MSSVKVSGSRTLRKGSKKGSKKHSHNGSKKGSKKDRKRDMDFASILNDMDDQPNQPNQMMQLMGQGQEQQMMPQMEMGQMMPGMGMGMSMDPGAMAQMAMPNMGYPQMSLGNSPDNVDPLHLQSFVPQNQNLNLNNFGINPSQLMSGNQMSQNFTGHGQNVQNVQNEMPSQAGGGGFRAYDAFLAKFM